MARQSQLPFLLKDRLLLSEVTWYEHKKTGVKHKLTSYICKCPTEGCPHTVTIRVKKHLANKCTYCSNSVVKNSVKTDYIVTTTEIDKTHLSICKRYPEYFLREEQSIVTGRYVAVMRCREDRCNNTVRVRASGTFHKCRSCVIKLLPFEAMFNCAKRNRNYVKKSGIPIRWLLSYEEFVLLCNIKYCHYCNAELNREEYRNKNNYSYSPLLDRKNSNIGYTFDNCVSCCPTCNFLKNQLSYEEMLLVMKHRGVGLRNNNKGD